MSQNLIANLLSNPSTALSRGSSEVGAERPTRSGASAVDSQDPMFIALLAMMQGGAMAQGGAMPQNLVDPGMAMQIGSDRISSQFLGSSTGESTASTAKNPMSPTELPERLRASQDKSARGISGSELLEKMGAMNSMANSSADGLWDGVEIEGASDFKVGETPKHAKGNMHAKHALFSGADFIAMKNASRPKLKDDAIMADRKLSMQSIDSLGFGQMLHAETELGTHEDGAIDGSGQATLFGHVSAEAQDKTGSNLFVGGQSLELGVAPGSSNEKYALKSESVRQLAQQIGNVRAQGAQTGEIRLRLRPDHLGELKVQVRADGRQVSLRFEAKDDRVKAALESAVSDLRDRLQSQNLNLGSVDVQVNREMGAQLATASQTPDFNAFDMNQQQNGAWMNSNGQSSSREHKNDAGFDDLTGDGLSRSRMGLLGQIGSNRASDVAAGRIDLRA